MSGDYFAVTKMPAASQPTQHWRRYLCRAEAAEYIRLQYGFPCSRQWLAKLAVIGGGPIFRKAGRTPIYAPADLDTWASARIGAPQRSTSDFIAVENGEAPAGACAGQPLSRENCVSLDADALDNGEGFANASYPRDGPSVTNTNDSERNAGRPGSLRYRRGRE
jgi:hypothetical protein